MTKEINIYVDKREFDFEDRASKGSKSFKLDSETSVSKLKADFFDILREIGRIHKFTEKDIEADESFASALTSSGSLVACFHERPPQLPCRLIQHTKGGLMLTGGFLNAYTFRNSTLNFVETSRQAKQLELGLGTFSPKLGVFAQCLESEPYSLQEKSISKNRFKNSSTKTLLYAGRIIPNKGISQLIRCLNIWPKKNVRIRIVGSYESDFNHSQSNSSCANFKQWFQRETDFSKSVEIEHSPALPIHYLIEEFHKSDVLVCPSFHEDEACGMTAHAAVLCGMPAIVTDWSGLGQLGRNNRGGLIATYASLGGVRFSLKALRNKIVKVISKNENFDLENVIKDAEWVKSIFNETGMNESAKTAISKILKQHPEPPPVGGWRCPNRLKRIAEYGPKSFKEALACNSDSDPSGLYADGTGYENGDFSEARFLTAIQGLYTTYPNTPKLRPGYRLHGFWRVRLWEEEKALVEFGFPGPRILRFEKDDWGLVKAASSKLAKDETSFHPRDEKTCAALQLAVDMGYLVPDDIEDSLFRPA